MRGFNGLPLADDIIDRILLFLPDFATLRSTILASKSFHNVFKTHPNSILRAVAYNITGPALPQALRCIRYHVSDPDDSETEDEEEMGTVTNTEHETEERAPIKSGETHQLVRNAKIVKDFENIFSLRHKNRHFKTSQLNFEESLRFHRAMYRIMLYCRLFPASKYNDMDDDDDDDDRDDLVTRLSKERAERKKFLSEFATQELYEIQSVSLFLVEVVIWVTQHEILNDDYGDIALSTGPATIHECVQILSPEPILEAMMDIEIEDDNEHPLVAGYLSYPLSKLYEERKAKPPPTDSSHWRSILEQIEGENDPCAHCNKPTGFDLWGPSTSEYLGVGAPYLARNPFSLAKGSLRFSRSDAPRFKQEFDNVSQDVYAIVDDILESSYKAPEFAARSANDWLCKECLTKLLKEHLHLWLLDKKTKAGDQIHENCWYGYNCRTMTHKEEHAKKLNHLCGPDPAKDKSGG
ncbi:hypothetical protein VNI00_007709 [Paramarasmius palmivorus]|uniref:Aprataxin and PNK-like factor PBZ domain-containing protein n=1 Tax=Paramarasmius palmivorus TaxID=297713 RepID=A0AAW0D072_9AGAR